MIIYTHFSMKFNSSHNIGNSNCAYEMNQVAT
jgi:hypothetical protein